MNSTKISNNTQNKIERILEKFPIISKAITLINQANGTAYLVGGAVRDALLNIEIKDIDIEVHNIGHEKLYNILNSLAPVSLVGTSFGVLKLHDLPVDWSLPRTDSFGRKPAVTIDPNLTIEKALQRRDLTINAIAINLTTFELIDPFDGFNDLQNKILRSPDINFFTQDPLRFYRVMQFISRFQMTVDDTLNNLCKTMDIKNVSIERIEAEFEKLLLKSQRPSLGLRWLKSINRLNEILPELASTVRIEQDPIWHPEGNVFEHLMQSVDAAAGLHYDCEYHKLINLYSALCHDLGKISTTQIIKGKIRSPGHAQAGVELAKNMLKRITIKNKLIESAAILVRYHMQPGQFINLNSSLFAYKRLANKLDRENTSMAMLAQLAIADARGRNANGPLPLTDKIEFVQEFIKRSELANVLEKPVAPILLGRDIMDIVKPGPIMGKLLKFAYEQQIKKDMHDKNALKDLVIAQLKNLSN